MVHHPSQRLAVVDRVGVKKLLLALGIGIASVIPVALHEAKPASAANYCYPWQGSCYWRWVQCGPYIYNNWAGFSCDRCGWCLA